MGKLFKKIKKFTKKLRKSKKHTTDVSDHSNQQEEPKSVSDHSDQQEEPKSVSDMKVPFEQLADNPGRDKELTILLFNKSVKKEIETVVTAELLQKKLSEKGWKTEILENGWLYQSDTGYYLLPMIIDVIIKDIDSVSTTTTIQINHKELFPNGIFEYQHSMTEKTVEEALLNGFDLWFGTDWETLMNAAIPEKVNTQNFNCYEIENYQRLVILGPVLGAGSDLKDYCCGHCLFRVCLPTLGYLINSNENYAIRVFAYKYDEDIDVDCRVNGSDDFKNNEEATEALINFVKTWPVSEYTFRKQYIIIINKPKGWKGPQFNDNCRIKMADQYITKEEDLKEE